MSRKYKRLKQLLLFAIVYVVTFCLVLGVIHFVDPLCGWDCLDKMQRIAMLSETFCAAFVIYKFITFKDEYYDGKGD